MERTRRTTALPPSGATWARIRRHLEAAIDLPQPRLDDYLSELEQREPDIAQEVATLLSAHRMAEATPSFLGSPVARVVGPRPSGEMPMQVGAYRLVREIGRGGMAKVFLAERLEAERRRAS